MERWTILELILIASKGQLIVGLMDDGGTSLCDYMMSHLEKRLASAKDCRCSYEPVVRLVLYET